MMESIVEFRKLPSNNVYESLRHQKVEDSLNDSMILKKARFLQKEDEDIVQAAKNIVEEVTKPTQERAEMFKKFQILHDCYGNLRVSMFWEEKLIIFIQVLQFLGVILTAFYEQFPQVYRPYLVFFFALDLNFPYIIGYESSITSITLGMYGCIASAALFSLISIPLIAYVFVPKFFDKAVKLPIGYKKAYFFLLCICVTPGMLNVTQYSLCFLQSSIPGIVLVNCWSSGMIYLIWACAIIVLMEIIAVIFILFYLVGPNVVYNSNPEQEKFVKTKEIEYSFHLSLLWERNLFFLFSSFKKQKLAPYHRAINMISQILNVLLFSILVLILPGKQSRKQIFNDDHRHWGMGSVYHTHIPIQAFVN